MCVMPPKTRGGKISKASKENIDANPKRKLRTTSKVTKPRKALADKTNSASDDNASVLPTKPTKKDEQDNLLVKQRPRRDRRLPNRYVECNVLQNLSNSKNASIDNKPEEPVKVPIVLISPLKTHQTNLHDSLIANRPKRICRLPSKFDDHSISPSKFVPVQPAYASTPKIKENIDKNNRNKEVSPKRAPVSSKVISTKVNRRAVQKKNKDASNSSADTNNNAKKDLPRTKNITKKIVTKSPPSKVSPTKSGSNKKVLRKDVSIRVLEDKKSLKRDASNIDVYEFTYDPNDEPPPQKKKRKKPAKKREPKPKNVVFKNNYDVNVAKALTALKNKVATNSTKTVEKTVCGNIPASKTVVNVDNGIPLAPATTQTTTIATAQVTKQATSNNPVVIEAKVNNYIVPVTPVTTTQTTTHTTNQVNAQPTSNNPVVKEVTVCTTENSHISQKNYNSVRVEDIALDFEDSYTDEINYSPVNSPCRPITPAPQNVDREKRPSNADPLNLREELSFFDENPVASSSMNVSVRNPAASPWRAEFGSLPIKWQVNTYVKANMTPAYESSFINFNDSKKKHVYTDMGLGANENEAPQIYEDNASKLRQTSIISYIKECVEKSAKKKKNKLTPIKNNSLFEDLNNTSVYTDAREKVTPKKKAQNKTAIDENVTPPNQDVSNTSTECSGNNSEGNKDGSVEKVRNSSKKKKDKDITYFGFDDSENQDQENVSPTKKLDKRKLRALKPRSRAVLQEINRMKEPTRVALPAASTKLAQSSDTVNKLFDQMKSAAEPPVFPEKEPVRTGETANVTEVQLNEDLNGDDADSVHLFEDIEVVHHLKTHRKSYGKAKKVVTFRQNSMSDSDVPASEVAEQSASSDEDDLHDLTFKMPEVEPKKTVRKKKTKKQKLSKKEQQEVEAWAAGFNSMCEDIEEFDLVVE
ncbi:uncharacterized protein [Epargyreus clarus]|uniref:uncharacterized protein n=1 Tax=Epargyreus clarus TaxID=520877 RepID=UPI003C2F962C